MLGIGLASLFSDWSHEIATAAMPAFLASLGVAAAWIFALLLYDMLYYWVHRTGHMVNIFWAAHVTHHSSEEFNLSTAMRQASTGFYFKWVFYLPLAWLGGLREVFKSAAWTLTFGEAVRTPAVKPASAPDKTMPQAAAA